MMDRVLLIDYENVLQVDVSEIDKESYKVKIFVGASQNKIPFDLVTAAQAFGPNLEWVKIDASGKNALDFHIAYFLGKYSQTNPNQEFIVLSKDTGFDPLMRFLNKNGVSCSRINSLLELDKNIKKGKIDYLKSEYRRYVDCPEFIEFWAKDLGLDRSALDNMFPKEVRAK